MAAIACKAGRRGTVETRRSEGEAASVTKYLDGKYESVSALESGYKELQSTFSKKTAEYNENISKYSETSAPENYELPEGVEAVGRVEALMDFGKDNNMSNEMLNKIIALDSSSNQAARDAYVVSQKEELGKDADTRLGNVQDWAKANGADEATFSSMMTSAKAVEFMESVMKGSIGTSPSSAPTAPSIDRNALNAMRLEKDAYGGRRMSSDAAFRDKVRALSAQLSD